MKPKKRYKEDNLQNKNIENTDENSVEIDFEEDLGFISEEEEGTETPEELLYNLNVLEQSIDATKVIILADLLNLYRLYSARATTRDTLYNTNESENYIDTSNFLTITIVMFTYASGIFFDIADRALQRAISSGDQNRISIARKAYWAALLIFISSIITVSAVDLSHR
ncbi:hypothetical protein A500_15520 [Clostridium sartagoforme AAU1]|uniref:Uncharacterized protein n=1 Tax=Clostridium sartagoforme AAU1 TaxID=1202534 RepID=R9BUN4_9CLOT|nr:hypothetical protein [Clostridium sartagoforme]EOR20737.1 hypothetical protein A500_15520 [Clostridium sartagoforme AAU1]